MSRCPFYKICAARWFGLYFGICEHPGQYGWPSCPFYQLCRSSDNPMQCIQNYYEEYGILRATGYEHDEAIKQLLEGLKTETEKR